MCVAQIISAQDGFTFTNTMQVQTFVNEAGDSGGAKGDEAAGSIWSGLNYKFGIPGLNQGSFSFDYAVTDCADLWVAFVGTRADGRPFTSGPNAGPRYIQASSLVTPAWPTACTAGTTLLPNWQHVEFNPSNTSDLAGATVTSIGTITFNYDGAAQNPPGGETEFVTNWQLGPNSQFSSTVFPVIDPTLTACPGNKNNGWLYANQP